MKALISAAQRFARDEEGITAIEYGLLAAVVVVAVGTAFSAMGDIVAGAFTTIGTKITEALT